MPASTLTGSLIQGPFCKPCPVGCKICLQGVCTTCMPAFTNTTVNLVSTCTPTCAPNQFFNTTCFNCSANCDQCINATACLRCASTHALSNGQCTQTCPTTSFKETFNNVSMCTPCDTSCSTCVGRGPERCKSCPTTGVIMSNDFLRMQDQF